MSITRLIVALNGIIQQHSTAATGETPSIGAGILSRAKRNANEKSNETVKSEAAATAAAEGQKTKKTQDSHTKPPAPQPTPPQKKNKADAMKNRIYTAQINYPPMPNGGANPGGKIL